MIDDELEELVVVMVLILEEPLVVEAEEDALVEDTEAVEDWVDADTVFVELIANSPEKLTLLVLVSSTISNA